MTKDFRKKTKQLIKRLVKIKKLKLYTMKINIGICSKNDFEEICDFLMNMWMKMYHNHCSIFVKWFAGFTRELIIEIDGEIIRPYLYFVLFANKSDLPSLNQLEQLAFFSILKINNIIKKVDFEYALKNVFVPLSEVLPSDYEKVIDDLMLPCVRVINPNQEIEELVDMYQYNRQLSSRGGIISKRNLERNVSLDLER